MVYDMSEDIAWRRNTMLHYESKSREDKLLEDYLKTQFAALISFMKQASRFIPDLYSELMKEGCVYSKTSPVKIADGYAVVAILYSNPLIDEETLVGELWEHSQMATPLSASKPYTFMVPRGYIAMAMEYDRLNDIMVPKLLWKKPCIELP